MFVCKQSRRTVTGIFAVGRHSLFTRGACSGRGLRWDRNGDRDHSAAGRGGFHTRRAASQFLTPASKF